MGILADQAMQRLRNVVAQERERAGETAVTSGGKTTALMRAAIIGAAFLVLASAVFLAQPNAGIGGRTDQPTTAAIAKGRAAFPLADGVTCRELVFDRLKGDIVDSNTAPCDTISRKAYIEPDRNGTSTGFTWGRR
jgi:hypothetical protein